mgnify:CR=1 FL=1
MERSKKIYDNRISNQDYRKAVKSKQKFAKKFGNDSDVEYPLYLEEIPSIGPILGTQNIRIGAGKAPAEFDLEKGLVVGNIRMGFGHYRISMAMASAAHAMGYTPYWMDLNSFSETTCTKVISSQNDLYSLGSRLSQKSKLFNKVVWEPMNYEGFRKLSYNASDQKNAELMAPVYRNLPKEVPVIATHVWPAQAALHAGMQHVVNAIPDNWPMALHLAEGAVHTIQTRQSYMGYRILNGMDKQKVLTPMPSEDLVYTGHYIDHELVANLEADCEKRINRANGEAPIRFLLTIGGAGAQKEIFAAIITHLLPYVKRGKAVIYVNVGDYAKVWQELLEEVDGLRQVATEHGDNWGETLAFTQSAIDGEVTMFWPCGVTPQSVVIKKTVEMAKAKRPSRMMPRVFQFRKLCATMVAPTEMPRKTVTMFIKAF